MDPFTVQRHDEAGGVIRLALGGELDIATAPTAERELLHAERDGNGVIVLDLRHLTFMDSTGLRLVLSAHARLHEAGARLVVCPGPEAVRRVFELTRTDAVLEMVDDPSTVASGAS